jgi:hypothetical protein
VVYTFDARGLQKLDLKDPQSARQVWDTMHLLAALQGLVNRHSPQLYLFYCSGFGVDTDAFWWDWFRGEDGWLSRTRVEALGSVEEALRVSRDGFNGLVVYDENVPATAKVASTAAGCERLLPVRYDRATHSLCYRCTVTLGLPVRLWLVNPDGSARFTGKGRLPDSNEPSSGSAKLDACRWGMTITGFVLDGAAGAATTTEFAAYAGFSPDGLGTHFEAGPAFRAGIATCPEQDPPDSVEQAAAWIARRATNNASLPRFLWARSILKPPRWYAELSQRLRRDHPETRVELVDPYTFFGLVAQHLGGSDGPSRATGPSATTPQ